jgi:hypothetical protein
MSRQKSYRVILTPAQRHQLEHQIHCGEGAARLLDHMRVLLKADEGPTGPAWTDQAICTGVIMWYGSRRVDSQASGAIHFG